MAKRPDIFTDHHFSSTYELEILRAVTEKIKKEKQLLPNQLVAPEMVRFGNRGVVVYHDMGSGKTLTAAECIVAARERKPNALVLVFTKASLKESFKDQVFRKFGNRFKDLYESYKLGLERIAAYESSSKSNDENSVPAPFGKKSGEMHFITHNAGSARLLEFIDSLEDKNMDDCIIVIDEAHELVNGIKNAESYDDNRYKVYLKFVEAERCIHIYLTGTIAVNYAKEIAIIYNMARGFFRKDLSPWKRGSSEARMTLFPYSPGEERATDSEFITYVQQFPSKFGMRISGMTSAYSPEYEIEIGTRKYRETKFYPESKIIVEDIPMTFYQTSLHKVIDTIETEKKRESILRIRGNPVWTEEMKTRMIESLYRSFEYSHAVCNFASPPILRPGGTIHLLRQQYLSDNLATKEFDVDKYISSTLFGSKASSIKKRAAEFSFEARKLARKYVRSPATPAVIFESLMNLMQEYRLLDLDIVEHIFSAKFAKIVRRIINSPGKHAVFTSFVAYEGLEVLSRLLTLNGISWVVYETGEEKALIEYNAPKNDDGSIIKVMFLTPRAVAGITLKNVRYMHIVENYWNEVRHQQAIARAIRLGSHDRLPEKDRDVTIYKYTSVFPEPQGPNNSYGTDDLMRRISREKDLEISHATRLLREFAIDRSLYFGTQVYPAMSGSVYRGDWSLDRISDDIEKYRSGDARLMSIVSGKYSGDYVSVQSRLRTGELANLLSHISEPEFKPRLAIISRKGRDFLVHRRNKVFEDIGEVSLGESDEIIFGMPVIEIRVS